MTRPPNSWNEVAAWLVMGLLLMGLWIAFLIIWLTKQSAGSMFLDDRPALSF